MRVVGRALVASVVLLACDAQRDGRGAGPGPITSVGQSGADEDGDDDAGDSEDSDDGSQAGDGEEGLGDCAEVEVEIDTVPPTVLVLVDRSWSMTKDFAGTERWGAVYRTLMHPDSGVIARLDGQVRFGLTLYTSKNGDEGGECPLLTEVAPDLDNAAQIDELLAQKVPIDEGPTGESLLLTAQSLAALDVHGPKAIVLATDGEPDTCSQPNPDEGQALAVQAAQSAHDLGIETFVVSVGDDVSEEHLQEMANVGVGRPVNASEPAPYYQALDADELVTAFADVVTELVRCDARIDGFVDLEQACRGTVTLDGEPLECGVDFELADESTLVLLGGACNSLKSGGTHELQGSWPCDAIDIP